MTTLIRTVRGKTFTVPLGQSKAATVAAWSLERGKGK